MVRIIFCIPAASSKSERVFSVAGRIVTPSRARTAPEEVENLVIMKCNMRLLTERDENQAVNNVNIVFLLDSVVLTCLPVYKKTKVLIDSYDPWK